MGFEETKPLLPVNKQTYGGRLDKSALSTNIKHQNKEEVDQTYGGYFGEWVTSSSKHPNKGEAVNSDGGRRAWLMVAAAFFCICVLDGTMYSFGVFMEPMMDDLKQPVEVISMVGSVQVSLYCLVAPVAGYFVRTKGARTVLLVGVLAASSGFVLASFSPYLIGVFGGVSLLSGTGFGLMYIPAVVTVAESFTTRRSLALGLSLCGAGAGQMGIAPLTSWVVGVWGWRVGLQVLCGVTLACIIPGLVMKKKIVQEDPDFTTSDDSFEVKRSCISVLLSKKIGEHEYVYVYLVVVFADALAMMALYIPFSYLEPVVDQSGVPADLTAVLVSAIGFGSILGRLSAGWMSDQPWCHPLYLTRAIISLSCVIPLLLSRVDQFWMFCGLSICFGLLTGQWIAATAPLLVDLLGIDQVSQAFSLLTAVRGGAALVSPPMAGLLVDLAADPLFALYLCGGLLFLSGMVYSLAIVMLKKKTSMMTMYESI